MRQSRDISFRNLVRTFSERQLYPSYGLAMVRIGYAIAIIIAIGPDLTAWSEVWGHNRSFLPANDSSSLTLIGLMLPLFILIVAFMMLVGFLTRLSILLLAVFYRVLVEQNAYLSDGGDNLLFITLIFLVFANTADVWSIDAKLSQHSNRFFLKISDRSWFTPIANGAWCLLIMQVCVVYAVAGLSKISGDRWMSGDGVAQSLKSVQFQIHPWLSNMVLEFTLFTAAASVLTVLVQVYFPFLIFNKWTKVMTLIIMISFHLGIGIVMGLTSFALVMIASEMAFISDKNMEDWFFKRTQKRKKKVVESTRLTRGESLRARSTSNVFSFARRRDSGQIEMGAHEVWKQIGLILIPSIVISSVVAPEASGLSRVTENLDEKQLIVSGEAVEDSVSLASETTGIDAEVDSRELAIGGRKVVFDVTEPGQALRFIEELSADPKINYVEVDQLLQSSQDHQVSGANILEDPQYHWNIESIGFSTLWEFSQGAESVIAVVDTGILPHPALENRVLPGVDLISDADAARDGDGRDMDPTDMGDWTNPGDCSENSPGSASTFHGTVLAGAIAGNNQNSFGIIGAAPQAGILPVRVSGACGARVSDIAEGIVWAIGQSVDSVSENLNPADVINISFAIERTCSVFLQKAIDLAYERGVHLVTSAGNHGAEGKNFSPGNCSNVINVGAVNEAGLLSSQSNFGDMVDIYGPGGDLDGGIAVPSVEGETTPESFSYRYRGGTSLAAAYVSAALGLIKSVYPDTSVDQREAMLINATQSKIDEYGRGSYQILSLDNLTVSHPRPGDSVDSESDGIALSSGTSFQGSS